jgi:hypothetical protein
MTMATKRKKKSAEAKPLLKSKARELIGGAIGAAVGSIFGRIFAEDPDGFVKGVMENVDKLKATGAWSFTGVPATEPTVEPTEVWFKSGRAGRWLAAPEDNKEHAFAHGFDGAPGWSACGAVYLKEPVYLKASNGRCDECVNTLFNHNYDVSGDQPRPWARPSAPPGKKSGSKKAKG